MMNELQPDFDVVRYQGRWYDVARFPKFFDWNVPWEMAEYRLKRDEQGPFIRVHNTAFNEDGTVKKEITGRARIVNPEYPAALHVSFPNLFSIFFDNADYPNYIVHETDYETFAIVGSIDRNSLYLLARQRPITLDLYEELLIKVARLGYDVFRLQEDFGSITTDSRL